MPRILITRPLSQSDTFAAALRAIGFETFFFPVIEIRPMQDNTALDRALESLGCYEWVVFTSVNGVKAVFERMSLISTAASIGNGSGVKVAAIGPKTAESLRAHGVQPAFVPQEYVAEAILPGLGDLRGRWVLLPRAALAREALPRAIAAAGGVAHEIAVYQTLCAAPDLEGLAALRAGVDVITLTSPSTVHNFLALTRANGLDPLDLPNKPVFACIGPITAEAAGQAGLSPLLAADEYTAQGMVEMLAKSWSRR